MRMLDATQMISLLPASSAAEEEAMRKLVPLHQQFRGDATRLRRLTEQGFLRTAEVRIEGKLAFLVWYRLLGSHYIVEMVASIEPCGLEAMVAAFERLATEQGCKFVEGMTSNKALAEFYLAKGYELTGVHFRGRCSSTTATSGDERSLKEVPIYHG
jgi:hypothetical protein